MVPALSLDESATYPAIHYAILVNEVSIVRLLRSAGASVDVRNAQRQRAIDVAVAMGKGDDILDALTKQEPSQRPADRTVAAVVEILWRCVGNNASVTDRVSEMERLRVTVNGNAFDPLFQHMVPRPLLPVHLAGKQDASAVLVTITLDLKSPHEYTFSIQYDDRPLSGYTASGRVSLLRGYWVCQVDRFMDH